MMEKRRKVFRYGPLLLIILLLTTLCYYQYLSPRIHPHKNSVYTLSTNQQLHANDSLRPVSSDTPTATGMTESVSDRGSRSSSHVSIPLPPKETKSTMDMPNIIFAMADDLGWGDVEYNNGKAHTPNLNKMASTSSSILLQRYYSGGPVCSPTRGTVLTGRNHNRYCLWNAGKYR